VVGALHFDSRRCRPLKKERILGVANILKTLDLFEDIAPNDKRTPENAFVDMNGSGKVVLVNYERITDNRCTAVEEAN
jgi:hypothetical protein